MGSSPGSWIFFVFVDRFTEADVSKVPASVNRLTEVGKGNRLRYSAINRDLSSEALGLARLQKSKTPASQKFYVVVYRTLHTPTSLPPPPTPSHHGHRLASCHLLLAETPSRTAWPPGTRRSCHRCQREHLGRALQGRGRPQCCNTAGGS
jgi:hypothetical protein